MAKNRRYYRNLKHEIHRLGLDASASVASGQTAPATGDPVAADPQDGDQQDIALFADPHQYDADANLVRRFGLSQVEPTKLTALQERMIAVGSDESTKPETMVKVYDQLRKCFEKDAELATKRHAAPLVSVDNRRQSVTIEEPEPEPATEIEVHPTVDISRRQQLAILMRDLFEGQSDR